MNKKSEPEDIANIDSSLFTESENLNPIMADKKKEIDSLYQNKQSLIEKEDIDWSSENEKEYSNSSVTFEEWETHILKK